MKINRWFAILCLVCGGVFVLNAQLRFMTTSQVIPGVLFLLLFLVFIFANRKGDAGTVIEAAFEDDSKVITQEEAVRLAEAKQDQDNIRFYAQSGIVGEYAFVVLPLVVVLMVGAISGWSWRLTIGSPEFSFGTALLFGQIIIKIVSLAARGVPHVYPITGLVSLLIVVGLVPSLLIMSFILTQQHPSLGLIVAQFCLFLLASFFYIAMGLLVNSVEIEDRKAEEKKKEFQKQMTLGFDTIKTKNTSS